MTSEIAILMLASPPAFLLGVLMLMVTRLVAGPTPGDRKPAYVIAIRALAWVLTAVGFIVGAVLLLPGLLNLWIGALAIIIAAAYGHHVATQRYAMLGLVGAAARRSMPLETAFAAFGHERGGWMRQRAAEIAYLLNQGASLPEALEAVPGVLPPEAVPLVCVGHENGSLGPAAAQAIATRNLFEPIWQSILPKIGYVCILPAVGTGIVAFIALKIMPQLTKIFRDFNTLLPLVTRVLIYVCRSPLLWLGLGVAFFFSAGLLVYFVLRYIGTIDGDPPGMGWLVRRRHIASVLDALALAAERQRPLGEAMAIMAFLYPQRSIARRLGAACDDMQAGRDPLRSLLHHGLLGQTDLALLQSARRNGNLAWAARELADSNRRRFIYRIQGLLQVIFPLVIVIYGLLIAAVAAAVFLPLAELIGRLGPL